MRFDDRLATVMALPDDAPAGRAAKWRQLVDLLAQRGGADDGDLSGEAFDYLGRERPRIDPAVRREVARALAGRAIDPDLFIFFTDDMPAIASPLIASARLTPDEWTRLLPAMSPTARALVRHRRDLDRDVVQALASFGTSDFSIAGAVTAFEQAEDGETQIRELVARIEAFRKHRDTPSDAQSPLAVTEVGEFRWEAGTDGTILWVEGAPRGPLVGQSIASISDRCLHGVDGQAAGAFERRSPFRDARFSVPGAGAAAGDWRISGVPFFDPARGHFLGYRGSARRPRVDEVARPAAEAPGLFGPDLPADSLRQLIHELRTPLNAIVGFAEMIDGQYLGPADAGYRSRAGDIMAQASRLLSAVDDLDTAARIETDRMTIDASAADAVGLLCRLHDSYERVAAHRGAHIAIEIMRDLPSAKVETDAVERMFARLLAATIGLAGEGETIGAVMGMARRGGSRQLCLTIDRPAAIAGLDEPALLDPGYSPEGDWPGAPALGLGFALRLVRNLAEASGGALAIASDRFALYLPALDDDERSSGQGL